MKRFVFDIDGTICKKIPEWSSYADTIPYLDRIAKINALFDDGHDITFFTARGMGRHKGDAKAANAEFYDMTYAQLLSWNVKFHRLILGKPSGDFYIDDKGISDINFFEKVIE